jgi:alanyl-tRNA synthetase
MTERLYYADSYCRKFTARVRALTRLPDGGRTGVVLDRTAFYPTSGGQPHDTGVLGGFPVVDVVEDGEDVLHVLEDTEGAAASTLAVGREIEGVVDWDRRYDHMQQHTAQHILSAAFLRVLGAGTLSVHLGGSCTLDLDVPGLAPEDVRRVEEDALRVVFDDRPVAVRCVEAGDPAARGLRRPVGRPGPLRLVEVEGYDLSACGGTHVRQSGEVGILLVRRWERVRGHVRVEFLAGWRAVRDYRAKHDLVARWSRRLGVRDQDLDGALDRLVGEGQDRDRALQGARRRLAAYEAQALLAGAPSVGPYKVLRLEFPQRDPEEIRLLLRELTTREPCLVLAGVPEAGRVYCARSAGDGPDAAALLSRASASVGGRAGGTAQMAQGTVPPGDAVRAVLLKAEAEVKGA